MVIIGDLPHEIRLQIINHLYREDLINFSLACKNFHYWAGEPLHEHRQLLQQWTIVSNRGKSGGYLASLVVEHLADARLSDYVEKLDITLNEPLAVNQGSGIDKTSYMAEAIGDSARFLWEEYGSRKIWEKWKSAVEEGDGAYIPQAWWLGLPKINSLTLSLEDSKLDALLEFLEPMYDETGEWFHIDCLDQLQRIQLQARHTPPRAEQAYRLLECCARIPSVTSLSAEHLDMNMSPPCPAFLVVFGSYVEFFRLECCTLGTSHSISLLSSMHKLEHFRCIDVTLDFHPDADGDRAAILTSLESAGKHTLRSLYIKREAITNADRNLLLGYLERFEVLQFVTLDLDVLLHGYERIWELPPGTILKASSLVVILEALRREKEERLPNFVRLILVLSYKKEVEELQATGICHRLRAVGVETIFKDGEKWENEEPDVDGVSIKKKKKHMEENGVEELDSD